MLHLLAEDNIPNGMSDVLMIPVGLTILAWLIFYAGWWVENRLTKAPWKWIAVVPALWAMWIGLGWVMAYRDPVYRFDINLAGGKKMMAAHYGALIIPILGLIGIVLFHFFNHKLHLDPDE